MIYKTCFSTILKAHFDISVLLQICYIFSEQLFLKIPLNGCFCFRCFCITASFEKTIFLPSWMSRVIQLSSSKLSFWNSWFLICNCMMMFLDAFSSNKNLFCSRKISLTSVNFSISEKWSLVAFSLLESRWVGGIFGGQGRFL